MTTISYVSASFVTDVLEQTSTSLMPDWITRASHLRWASSGSISSSLVCTFWPFSRVMLQRRRHRPRAGPLWHTPASSGTGATGRHVGARQYAASALRWTGSPWHDRCQLHSEGRKGASCRGACPRTRDVGPDGRS